MSPSVTFDHDALHRVAAVIYEQVNGRDIVNALQELKQKFDWNPFDEDGDEFIGPWNEVRQNFKLIGDLAMAVVHVAERITIAGVSLNDAQKHAACVQALDDIVRLPWYIEPFDNVAFDMAISAGVAAMNGIGWLRTISGQTLNAQVDKLDVTERVAAITTADVKAARAKMAGAFREIG